MYRVSKVNLTFGVAGDGRSAQLAVIKIKMCCLILFNETWTTRDNCINHEFQMKSDEQQCTCIFTTYATNSILKVSRQPKVG